MGATTDQMVARPATFITWVLGLGVGGAIATLLALTLFPVFEAVPDVCSQPPPGKIHLTCRYYNVPLQTMRTFDLHRTSLPSIFVVLAFVMVVFLLANIFLLRGLAILSTIFTIIWSLYLSLWVIVFLPQSISAAYLVAFSLLLAGTLALLSSNIALIVRGKRIPRTA